MPDIVIDCPEYNRLNDEQKDLIQSIVKPEADALQELIESELEESGELEDLERKHLKKTIMKINKLLSSGITKTQIKSLIQLLNIEKLSEIDDAGSYVDEDEASQTSLDKVGFDCNHFHWTRRCVDMDIEEYMATLIQSLHRGNKSRFKSKSKGRITLKQKLKDWPKLKHQLRRLGYGDQEIDYFYENHYLPSAGKKKPKPKQKSKKLTKPKKSRKRKKKSKLRI